MLFNSAAYLVFLPIVVALYWLCPFKFRTLLLLVASYVFYMTWNTGFGLLMFGLTLANFVIGNFISKSVDKRKSWLIGGIVLNLVTLGFFKYTYFTRNAVNGMLGLFPNNYQLPAIPFDIILPLGISFFVFEFIHYLSDVYKGHKPVNSFLEFALFASFFPTQIAGPIKRYQDFIPQLHKPLQITVSDFDEGIELILFGLFKKVLFADSMAPVVNRCFAHPDLLTSADVWLAVWAFAFQIYFDFSGYTDIARGSARLLGFKVPINFQLPLMSSNVTELWRRWHISLSTWLRDYLFIPLGGSKYGSLFTARNIFITMTLGGLWHGADFNFVAWGAFNGLLIPLHKVWQDTSAKIEFLQPLLKSTAFHVFSIFLTFQAFCFGLLLFRASSVPNGILLCGKALFLSPSPAGYMPWDVTVTGVTTSVMFPLLPVMLTIVMLGQIISSRLTGTPGIMPFPSFLRPLRPVYLACIACLLMIFSPDITPQFFYFQF